MRVLGIDPGTALMGYGVVEARGSRLQAIAYGPLTTAAGVPMHERLLSLHQQVTSLIIAHSPDILAVEELFFGRNVTTAITVGQARGVALLAGAQANLPVAEYTPAQVKQTVVGWGRADKNQVQDMVRKLLHLPAPPRPDDVADALAVAITCAFSRPLEEKLGRHLS